MLGFCRTYWELILPVHRIKALSCGYFRGFRAYSALDHLNTGPHLRPCLEFCWQLVAVLQFLQQNVHLQSPSAENVSFMQSLF